MYLIGKGPAKLSPALEEKLEKLQKVDSLLARDKSVRVVAGKLMNLWPGECSLATAYRLIGEAQEVFATEQLHNRSFYIDALISDVASTRAKALAAGDLKTVAACDKNMAAIIEKFMGTNDAMPIEKIQPPRLTFGFLPELAGQALPDDWEAQVANIVKVRRTGVVADHPDFQDAQIVDETKAAGGAAADAREA
jgi:hypothetical protein